MKLLIDRSGRIVVPKRLRERFGFRPDSEIEVVEGPGGLLLRPAQEKPSLPLRKTAAQPHHRLFTAGFPMRNVLAPGLRVACMPVPIRLVRRNVWQAAPRLF